MTKSLCRVVWCVAVSFLLWAMLSPAVAQGKKNKKHKTTAPEARAKAEALFADGMREHIIGNYKYAIDFFEQVLKEDPNATAAYYRLGKSYEALKDIKNAILFAKSALEKDDKNKYYYVFLGELYEKSGDYEQAGKVYERMMKNVPGTEEYQLVMGSIYFYLDQYDKAIDAYDRAEEYLGVSEELSKQKEQIYLKLDRIDDAVREARKLAEAMPEENRYMLSLAELLIANKKNEEAKKILKSMIHENKESEYAGIVLAEVFSIEGKKDSARMYLSMAFRSEQLDPDAKIGILVGYMRAFPDQEAKETALMLGKIAAEIHPANARLLAINGDILTLTGHKEEALKNYKKACELDNSNFKVWQQIIMLNSELQKIDSMIAYSDRAVELFPNQSMFYFYAGTGYLINKNHALAVKRLEKGKKLSGDNKELLLQFHAQLGDSYNGLQEHKKADENFEEALKIDPENAHVLNNYGYFLSLRKENLDKARKMGEKLIKAHPEDPTYLDTYGWILYVAGDYEKARIYLEKAMNGLPENGTIVEHYGDVLYQLGQKDKALEIWKKARSLGETSDFLPKKIADHKLYE